MRMYATVVTLVVILFGVAAYGDEESDKRCPAITSFPFLEEVFGKGGINVGDSLGDLEARFSKVGTKEAKGDNVGYLVKAKGARAFDVHSVKLDFHGGKLKRVKMIYQVAPAGTKKKSEFDSDIATLLGKIDGHIKGPEGRLLKAWKKGTILIAQDYNDTIMWYIIEVFDQGK